MPLPLVHDEDARRLARLTYRTLEPLHLLAYFNPYARERGSSLVDRWRPIAEGLPTAGRPLAAAGASLPRPDEPLPAAVACHDAAAGVWASVGDGATLIEDTRPLVKQVIDAGVLPGTGRG